jgi:hypothetical protein
MIAQVTVQEKIAELESRIAALEKREGSRTTVTRSTTTTAVDLEPEMGRIWKAVDAFFAKAFQG